MAFPTKKIDLKILDEYNRRTRIIFQQLYGNGSFILLVYRNTYEEEESAKKSIDYDSQDSFDDLTFEYRDELDTLVQSVITTLDVKNVTSHINSDARTLLAYLKCFVTDLLSPLERADKFRLSCESKRVFECASV